MNLNPSVLPAGAAIKCSASDTNVYRLVDGGSYRLYPTSEIAASWGASAATATAVECPVLTKGTDMNLNPSGLLVGQAIKCSSAELAIYRLVSNGVYRLYPNPAIALSWDPNMSWIPVVECSVLTKGPEMAANTLTIGSSLKCGQNEAQVYRYDSPGVYRYYPSPSIALSWNPTYYLFTVVDCTVMRRGPDMAKKV